MAATPHFSACETPMLQTKKHHIFHALAGLAVIGLLAACDMPTRPDGIDIEGLTQIGDKLHAQGDDSEAVDFYQRALQRKPSDAHARAALAQIYETHGMLEDAAAQYREGLALDEDDADLLRGYGRVLLKQSHADEAKDEYEKALREDSDDTKALNGLGLALDMLGNHSAAQQSYRTALEDAPDDMTVLANLGHSYVLTGAYDEAIKLLEPYAMDKNATPTLRQNLAEAYGMSGMEADAERMGRMDLSAADVQYNLAYYRKQRAKLALVPSLYADLGSFATEDMAKGRAEAVNEAFAAETAGLVVSVAPQVKSIGGTPSFTVMAAGFAKPDKLRAFCEHLKKAGFACKPHGA